MRKLKLDTSRILLIVGVVLLSYSTIAGVVTRQQQRKLVSTYESSTSSTSEDVLAQEESDANYYNNVLYKSQDVTLGNQNIDWLSDDSYNSLLNSSGTGVMGSLEIPKIDVDLPIYHGTSDDALSNGVGHQQGSSLPVGGKNTRCILTGHRGIPGSSLFTRLDELSENDLFFIKVLNETLAYKVYKIEVIDPEDVDGVYEITEGADECSLVTCTPYGLNTQRLIVTGKRVTYSEKDYNNIKKGLPSLREIVFTLLPIVVIMVIITFKVADWRKKHEKMVKKFSSSDGYVDLWGSNDTKDGIR